MPLTGPNPNQKTKDNNKQTTQASSSSKSTTSQNPRTLTDFLMRSKTSHSVGSSSSSSQAFQPPSLKRSYSAISSLDTANEHWLNTPIAPKQKRIDTKEVYDRLTPGIADMHSAQVLMSKTQPTSYFDIVGSKSYQEQVANACGIYPDKRILRYGPAPPPTAKVDITKNTQPTLNTSTSSSVKRHIITSPEKILDAPYMIDDYYLNVLDWSCHNVVAVGLGKSVYLWSADNGTIQALNYDYDDPVASLSYSADGAYLAVGTTKGDTQIWDVQANKKLRSMKGQDCRVGVLSWDKHIISSGARDGSIFSHDVRLAKHVVRELYGHADEVCGLKWRWDGELLASGGNDNTVNIWDARTTTPKYTKRTHVSAVKALAWCPWNRSILATGGGRDDKKIHFWNTTTCARLNTIHAGSQVTSLHWSQHYKEIVSTHGLPHNQVTVWGYPTLNKIIDIPAHETRILHSALSPDGQVLATAAADENLKFWRIFESNGKAPLASESARLTEKKEIQLRRSKSIR
ncbi:WD40 repeat-like protein [Rhizopus microsporus]|nr:WD40 repeat-like protein [Rhizopus microsporus]